MSNLEPGHEQYSLYACREDVGAHQAIEPMAATADERESTANNVVLEKASQTAELPTVDKAAVTEPQQTTHPEAYSYVGAPVVGSVATIGFGFITGTSFAIGGFAAWGNFGKQAHACFESGTVFGGLTAISAIAWAGLYGRYRIKTSPQRAVVVAPKMPENDPASAEQAQ